MCNTVLLYVSKNVGGQDFIPSKPNAWSREAAHVAPGNLKQMLELNTPTIYTGSTRQGAWTTLSTPTQCVQYSFTDVFGAEHFPPCPPTVWLTL